MKYSWPKGRTSWRDGRTLYMSIPFTWNLPGAYRYLSQGSLLWDYAVVGGPAVQLMPDYFSGLHRVEIGQDMPGVLQKVNPWATRTTLGCIRNCSFCAVKSLEGKFRELDDWPDLPVVCDNNLLAASTRHFDRVMDRLEGWGWADFNSGLDARILNEHHAKRLERIKGTIRLSLDDPSYCSYWEQAYCKLRAAKIPKHRIRTYVLVGFKDDPGMAWDQCNFIRSHGIDPLPQWFHPLDALGKNQVTPEQQANGWNDYERRRIMQWFYKRKEAVFYPDNKEVCA